MSHIFFSCQNLLKEFYHRTDKSSKRKRIFVESFSSKCSITYCYKVDIEKALFFYLQLVRQYERLVVYRLGKLHSMKGPGLGFVLPCIDSSTRVDIRTRAFSVPPQKVNDT